MPSTRSPTAYTKQPIRIVKRQAGAHLSRQRHRVRPDQLLPPARQFLRLLRSGHDADADAEDGRPDHPVPGAARHPRVHLQGPRDRASTCSTPTSRNSPNSAGSACSTSWRPCHERGLRRARRAEPRAGRRRSRSLCSGSSLPLAALGLAIAWLLLGQPAAELRQRRAAGREPDLRAHDPRRRRHPTSWSAPAARSR